MCFSGKHPVPPTPKALRHFPDEVGASSHHASGEGRPQRKNEKSAAKSFVYRPHLFARPE